MRELRQVDLPLDRSLALSPLGRLLAHVDKVAGGFGLAGDVRLEVSVDSVLHLAAEGLVQEASEVLQAVRVVGQTEFTAKDRRRIKILSQRFSIVLLFIVFLLLCLTQPVGNSHTTLTRTEFQLMPLLE